VLSTEAFSRAAFDRITSARFEILKKRLVVASEAIQVPEASSERFAMLDDAIASGARYNELIKAYLGLGPLPGAEPSGGKIRSAIRAWQNRSFDEGEATIVHQLRKAGRLSDLNVLNMITHSEWMARFPTSTGELVSSATQWILERLEVQSTAYARRTSDEQFRSAESTYRGRVENTFQGMFTLRLQKLKEEVNKVKVEAYPG
jgi:hypothetical protein